MTPQNIEYYATFLHPGVNIQERVIQFGPRSDSEPLLVVPIGQIDQHATVVLTLGQNKARNLLLDCRSSVTDVANHDCT